MSSEMDSEKSRPSWIASLVKSKRRRKHPTRRNNMLTIVSLITALIGFLVRIWPDPKTASEIERDKLKEIHDADTKYQASGDNTDIGRIP